MLKSIPAVSLVRCVCQPSLSLGREQVGLPLESKEWFCHTTISDSQRAFSSQSLQDLDYAVWFSCHSINACSPSFSGDHTSWSLPGSDVKKQESQERCKVIPYIQKQPWDALSSAGNFVCHKVMPGWCFLDSKSHLVTNSQKHWLSASWDASYQPRLLSKPAWLGCSFQNPTETECPGLLESFGSLAAIANCTQAAWESGIMLNSRICSNSWNKIAVLKLPVDRNHRFSIKLTLKKGLLSRETSSWNLSWKPKCFHLYDLKG